MTDSDSGPSFDFDYRPETRCLTRQEAGTLLDWLPVMVATSEMPDPERDVLDALHRHLRRILTPRDRVSPADMPPTARTVPMPDGYVHCASGRSLLACRRCGALVCTDGTAQHDDWHEST